MLCIIWWQNFVYRMVAEFLTLCCVMITTKNVYVVYDMGAELYIIMYKYICGGNVCVAYNMVAEIFMLYMIWWQNCVLYLIWWQNAQTLVASCVPHSTENLLT